MRKKRAAMTKAERGRQNRMIRKNLFADPIWKQISWLYPYVSCGTEVDTWAIIRHVLSHDVAGRRIRVAVPRVQGTDMEFYEITSVDELCPGYQGIYEPVPSCPSVGTGDGLMLLPGLAFDRSGHRVGYGGGYYDRYLGSHPGKHRILYALAYDLQIVDRIETEEFDICPQKIITSQLHHNLNNFYSRSDHKGNIIPC